MYCSISVLLAICMGAFCVYFSLPAYADEDLKTQLENIDGIHSVQEYTPGFGAKVERKFMLEFVQPIDWNGEVSGTFTQRVEFAYRGKGNVNLFKVGGYCLRDVMNSGNWDFSFTEEDELAEHYNANYILIEYRYFGYSVPEGVDHESADLWKYCTVENAAKDFHSIISKLKTVLDGKSIFTGGSKGGYTTNYQAASFPDDCEAFVSYSAPFCKNLNDTRMYKYMYENAGNSAFDAATAQQCRNKVLAYQVECIKLRDVLQPKLINDERISIPDGLAEWTGLTEEEKKSILFDIFILDSTQGIWLFQLESKFDAENLIFSDITKALNETDRDEKANILWSIIQTISLPAFEYSGKAWCFPYRVQCWMQMGDFFTDFSYLRNALKSENNKANNSNDLSTEPGLFVTEGMEENFTQNLTLTNDMRSNLPQGNQSANNAIENMAKNGTANCMMLFGGVDPWYATAIPNYGNPNIPYYVCPTSTHAVQISHFDESVQNQIYSTIDKWVSYEPAPISNAADTNQQKFNNSTTAKTRDSVPLLLIIYILCASGFFVIKLKSGCKY